MKPKFQEKLLLNYMDTDSFIYTIKIEDFYKDIRNDLEAKFDTSDFATIYTEWVSIEKDP